MIFEKRIISIYDKKLLRRRDPDGLAYHFTREDFAGLESRELSFSGDKGQILRAYIYHRGGERTDRLVILEHGMGCGHASYLQEIDVLTSGGYTVFTYDHTGTLLSGGNSIGGFSQSLSDLDRAVSFVRTLEGYETAPLSIIGHSWGGYSTMNIAAIHPEISHVVALSGFISTKAIQDQALSGLLRLYRPTVYRLEREALPDYYRFDARESLRESSVKALIIHSRDDKTCHFDKHFQKLEQALGDNERIKFLAVDEKGHYPQYTKEAVKYKHAFNKTRRDKLKRGELESAEDKAKFVKEYDWFKMSEQDMELWNKIFEFLNS